MMTRMVIDERTLSPVFVDEDDREPVPYAGCDWEPYCLVHGDMCEMETPVCLRPATEHPRCDGVRLPLHLDVEDVTKPRQTGP